MAQGRKRGNGEGSICRIKGRRSLWRARAPFGYGPDGKLITRAVYGKTRAEAHGKLLELLNERKKGLVPPKDRTLETLMGEWIAALELKGRRPRTINSYKELNRLHILPDLGRRPIMKLNREDIQTFLNGKLASGLSSRTVQYIRGNLRAAFNFAMKREWLHRNVVLLTDPITVQRYELPELSIDLAVRLLECFRGHRQEAMFATCVGLGLRIGEILGLRWSDVHLDEPDNECWLEIRTQLQRLDGKYVLSPPKSRAGKRKLYLPQFVSFALRSHRQRQDDERRSVGEQWSNELGLVFVREDGGPLHDRTTRKQYKQLLAKAAIDPLRFHDLRHVCASLLIAQGQHIRTIMQVLGHSQVSQTLEIYGHLMTEVSKGAAMAVDEALKRSSPPT